MGIKRGLMVQFPCARGRTFVCKNIGDYVQSIAARQFVDPVDEYVEQEEADQYYPEDKKKIKLIMNGWFQWRAENWPPSDYIEPLLISMHISPLRADKLLNEKGIRWLPGYLHQRSAGKTRGSGLFFLLSHPDPGQEIQDSRQRAQGLLHRGSLFRDT